MIDDVPRTAGAARAESELFRLIAEYTYDWETWVDADGRARWLNSAVERITGRSVAECLRDPAYPLSLVHVEDRPVVARALREAAAGSSGNDVEFRVSRRDGASAWVAMSWQPVRGTAGENLGYRTSVRDIDARKRMEGELHAMRRRAEHALRARSALLANVSHELRSPVHCIAGFAELLTQQPLDTEQRHYVDVIYDQCQAMLHQVEDLLGLAALEADGVRLKHAPFDVALLVRRIVEACEPRARAKPITLTADVASVRALRTGDALRLRQIIRNVLDNALKFTDSGAVSVHLRDGVGHDLICEVTDTGSGMAAEDVARMFEPFVQGDDATTRRHGGVGLGLSIARRLAHAMHGELSVDSQLGRGTRVTIRVPLADAAAVLPPSGEAPRDAHFPAHVLVVDDSAPARELLGAMLRRFGATSVFGASGADAKQQATDTPVDLVLIDYQMPDMDGAETAVALRRIFAARAQSRHVPIYLLTANVFVREELGVRSAVFDGILEKPLALGDLARLFATLPRQSQEDHEIRGMSAVRVPEGTLLDERVILDLAQTCGHDGAPLLGRFAPRVLAEVRSGLSRLSNAGAGHAQRSAEARFVHALVGNALSIGARGLGDAFHTLEAALDAGDDAAFRVAREHAQRVYDATCHAFQARGIRLPDEF